MKLFSRRLLTTTHNVTVANYQFWEQEGDLDLTAYYQRGYVWEDKEQQEFLYSLFNNLPIGTIAIIDRDTYVDGEANYEVVDGKQRITTILMFLNNEIPYIVEGVSYLFKDLDQVTSRQVRQRSMPYQCLYHGMEERDKLEYFYRVNFTGVPQSEEHMNKIEELMKNG